MVTTQPPKGVKGSCPKPTMGIVASPRMLVANSEAIVRFSLFQTCATLPTVEMPKEQVCSSWSRKKSSLFSLSWYAFSMLWKKGDDRKMPCFTSVYSSSHSPSSAASSRGIGPVFSTRASSSSPSLSLLSL